MEVVIELLWAWLFASALAVTAAVAPPAVTMQKEGKNKMVDLYVPQW